MSLAVVTLNKGRGAHLARLLEGLAKGRAPDRCIVVEMGGDTTPLPPLPFPVERVPLAGEGLPLAAARNAGRRAAGEADTLVYLDVDCIPSADLVAGLAAAVAERDGLICCAVRYLPAGAVRDGWHEADLAAAGHLHPVRHFPKRDRPLAAARPVLVAGLRGAGLDLRPARRVRRELFRLRRGGHGPRLPRGRAGVPILFLGGPLAFHQHHAAYDPPLQHFRDIVANAQRFHDRHGIWPMDGWLDGFARLGLIAETWREGITLRRDPTPEEIAAARCRTTARSDRRSTVSPVLGAARDFAYLREWSGATPILAITR